MVSYRSLSDNKFPQVFRTLPSILFHLNYAVVWMVSTCPLISKSHSPFTNPFGIVPSAPFTISITVTFTFHRFLKISLAGSRYLSFFSLSFIFTLLSAGTAKFPIRQVLFFFLLTITRTGHLAEIR